MALLARALGLHEGPVLSSEVPLPQVLAVLDHEIVHQVSVEFLEVADKAGLTHLQGMEESQIRLKLSVNKGSMHFPRLGVLGFGPKP